MIIARVFVSSLLVASNLVLAVSERASTHPHGKFRGEHRLEDPKFRERGRRNVDEDTARANGFGEPSALRRDSMCSSCVDRQLYLNFTKEEIRKDILRKLDMNAPPKVSAKDIPEHLVRELIRKYGGDLQMMGDDPFAGRDEVRDDDEFFKPKGISLKPRDRK